MDEKGETVSGPQQRRHISLDVIRGDKDHKKSYRIQLHGISPSASELEGLDPELVKKIKADNFYGRREDNGQIEDLRQGERMEAHTLFGTPLPPDLERGLRTSRIIATRKRK